MTDKKVLEGFEDEEQLDFEWDKKKAKRMIRRTRLGMIFVVLRTVVGLFLLYAVYSGVLQAVYHSTAKNQQFDRLVTTYVELHDAGLRVEKGMSVTSDFTPWLTQKTQLNLYENVGDWQVNVGNVTAEKSPYGMLNVQMNLQKKYLQEPSDFEFALPEEISHKVPMPGRDAQPEVWQQLTKIPDGYVAEMGFSTKHLMAPEDLFAELKKYDLHLIAMPVYGGELKTITDITNYGSSDATFAPTLVLRPAVQYNDQSMVSSWGEYFDAQGEMAPAKTNLLQSVDWLTQQGNYPGQQTDKERLAYLKQNGVQVFGAVVTGPVKELLKLQNDPNLHQFQIGRIEVWKWKD